MAKNRGIRDIKERKIERKRKKRKARRAAFLIFEILVFVILLGATYMTLKYNKMQFQAFADGEIQVNEGVDTKGYTTLALFGGDSRQGVLEEGTHSDTIIVVSINDKTKEVKMVSVYRDTLTQQTDGNLKKANNAYFVGGPKNAVNMLNKNFDLNIQGYVTVNFSALADVVDLLGGIEVEVSDAEAVQMNKYIKETAKVVGKPGNQIAAGTSVLDGVQAVTYSRIRKNVGGDYKRVDRQREVLEQVAKKAKKAGFSTLNKIINEVFPKISTSLSMADFVKMASGATRYHIGESKGFPFEKIDGRTASAGSVIVPLGVVENVQELHAFLYAKENYIVSDTVKTIAGAVEQSTGYTRADYTP